MRQVKDIIRGMREDRDLKQKDIAKVLGVSQQYYSKYEAGIYEIPYRHIITLCKFYGITADYLLGLIEHEFPIGNSAFELCKHNHYQGLNAKSPFMVFYYIIK